MAAKTPQQEEWLDGMRMGLTPIQAASRASYKNPKRQASRLLKDPALSEELHELRKTHEKEMKMSREKVQQIVVDAIDMGRIQADPMAMIRGAQELNKMLGYYAPEKKTLKLSGSLKRLRSEFEDMSDEALLAAIAEDEIIEGDYVEVNGEPLELPAPEADEDED